MEQPVESRGLGASTFVFAHSLVSPTHMTDGESAKFVALQQISGAMQNLHAG
jgi:uncharacterized protein with von Willebrand factor type A (vWA) domain